MGILLLCDLTTPHEKITWECTEVQVRWGWFFLFQVTTNRHEKGGSYQHQKGGVFEYALWICLQEKAHVAGEIQQRRELSARAAFFCGWWECKLDQTRLPRSKELSQRAQCAVEKNSALALLGLIQNGKQRGFFDDREMVFLDGTTLRPKANYFQAPVTSFNFISSCQVQSSSLFYSQLPAPFAIRVLVIWE